MVEVRCIQQGAGVLVAQQEYCSMQVPQCMQETMKETPRCILHQGKHRFALFRCVPTDDNFSIVQVFVKVVP